MTHRLLAGAVAATTLLLSACVALAAPAGASSSPYAPLDRPGPALSVPESTVAAATVCHGDLAHSSLEPVLLNPATGVTAAQNYSWNYERAFTAQGRPWCAVTMPHSTLDDIQVSAQYLVRDIRVMHATAHRRIAILGHSQGGMSMRWALRFWPDTRAMVDDVIGMAGSNHGTTALPTCIPHVTQCTAAVWQQLAGSQFVRALNSGAETFAGISYTEIFTHTDEVVQPNSTDATSSSALHTGAGRITNVSTQDVCPGDVLEHLGVGTVDPVAYALVMDALDHAGPAVPARIDRATVCSQLLAPDVDPASVNTYLQVLQGLPGLGSVPLPFVNLVGAKEYSTEPPLACYTTARGC